ncbi:putative receptor protein kinase ZmPK1 [Neltuma alba]|uniref:putative receptor protein kinase ZmPK1 n=1 Tax=Neltuma alba TaxID=207710 RepID=UPI0010A54D8B|nr:putative receptor protein kinase ZmPK1 [Prosopis alba]
MAVSLMLHFPLLLSLFFQSSSSSHNSRFSLSVEKPEDVILSQNGVFSAGFYLVGENAYVFSIWFAQTLAVVWTANRDRSINGKRSSLSIHRTGNLVLSDAGQYEVWSTATTSSLPTQLILNNNGNLVLYEHQLRGSKILWQSFDFPTDTLLPGQQLTRYTKLVSARSETNYSSGFYKLVFDDENVLTLLYDGPDVSSKYWPSPWLKSWEADRNIYDSSRIAVLDSLGGFSSTDKYNFTTSDYGVLIQRRLKLDPDGNIRVYSLQNNLWEVTWQAISDACIVHGLCGADSTCVYDPREGRKCSCLPGYRVKNHSDWSYGCEPTFKLSCNKKETTFFKLQDVELYGYDFFYKENISYSDCENECIEDCECRAFQYSFNHDGLFQCYAKRVLLNGRRSPDFRGTTYLRLPKTKRNNVSFFADEEFAQDNGHICSVKLDRAYAKRHVSSFLKFFLWFSVAIGLVEVLFISMTWFYLIRTKQKSDGNQQGYNFLSPFGFRKYTYSELKQATKGFTEEIGRGAGGIVYKGVLPDQRTAAIKNLHDDNIGAKRDEAEFLAEVSIIGKLNHMNLIEMWGYCAEGKHRLLVYEYLEKGSLADNLKSNTLDWTKRYNIALGTARVLAYLHEECLEWILHCDIKPQNILLGSNYQPKVADFGLSKLLNRSDQHTQNFSVVRGTRGYMAPEWVFNLPITSKVDVYSFGIVVLEMITGRSPTMMGGQSDKAEEAHNERLVMWVREKRKKMTSEEEGSSSSSWVEQIIEAAIGSEFDVEKKKMETLANVALKCVEEDKDARPSMSQVVEMLQSHEDDAS